MKVKDNPTRERDIEKYLTAKIAQLGGKAYKFSSANNRAVPDRICFLPNGLTILVECKAPGKLPTPLQAKVIQQFRDKGHLVYVVDNKLLVNELCEAIKEIIKNGKNK